MGRFVVGLLLEIILLALRIQTGEGIKCYICTSLSNDKCADPIDKSGLEPVECTKSALEEAASTLKKGVQSISNYFGIPGIPEGANIDLKFACQKLDISDPFGKKQTSRMCSIAKSESVDPCPLTDSASKKNGQGKVDFCETCETDLCNGSNHHSITIISALVMPCIAVIISHWIGV